MTIPAWLRLLRRNRCAVSPSRIPLVVAITVASLLNSTLALVQSLFFARRIRRFELRDDPIFILGHWRSGTTLLHELLTLDPQHNAPSTYACLAPSHFLISQPLFGWLLKLLLPPHRSQDNVVVGFDQPQEDEWAICTLGLPTLYQAVAFPQQLKYAQRQGLDNISHPERNQAVDRWLEFLKAVSLATPEKRLVLKSPLHTARIPLLLRQFPNARFVYIERDRSEVLKSTDRLWRLLAEDEGLQGSERTDFEAFVRNNYEQLHCRYQTDKSAVPPGRLYEVRYEDLTADPSSEIRNVYEFFGFDPKHIHEPLKAYTAAMARFRTATYPPECASQAPIKHRTNEGEQFTVDRSDAA